ncbi:MAG TPA: thiopeptide-type bacteriocin biosynthesis protein [Jatrophihabitans sp.]|nr:thiopeptide-type bacteriocin biosynthesis protein [Jatrophihabitans sp.]
MSEQPRQQDTDRWISLHTFYAANSNPVLVHCIGPLVAELRERGLIEKWFFIRYWLEGPHTRLRLLPKEDVDPDEVRQLALSRIAAFLKRRPALYEEDRNNSDELYKNMFLAEYPQQRWDELYGAEGRMPFRDNNTVAEIGYEREYSRYGGPAAMALAESHFERSSDHVLSLLASTNVHVRTVLLGQAAQNTAALCLAFLPDEAAIAEFLTRYRTMWESSYGESSDDQHEKFDRSYDRMAERFVQRLRHLRAAARGERPAATPGEQSWLAHCAELRDQVVALAEAGELTFRDGVITDPAIALPIVLSSYVHMTNNRLGASILDEIYLAYVISRAMREIAPAEVG